MSHHGDGQAPNFRAGHGTDLRHKQKQRGLGAAGEQKEEPVPPAHTPAPLRGGHGHFSRPKGQREPGRAGEQGSCCHCSSPPGLPRRLALYTQQQALKSGQRNVPLCRPARAGHGATAASPRGSGAGVCTGRTRSSELEPQSITKWGSCLPGAAPGSWRMLPRGLAGPHGLLSTR